MGIEGRERLPVSVSSAVFIQDESGNLLLLQQAADSKGYKWGPPAGGMEAHEDPILAAQREAREEIGLDIELIDMIGIYTTDRGDKASGIGFVFRGKIKEGDIRIQEDEIKDYRFFNPEELDQLAREDMLYRPEYNLPCIRE